MGEMFKTEAGDTFIDTSDKTVHRHTFTSRQGSHRSVVVTEIAYPSFTLLALAGGVPDPVTASFIAAIAQSRIDVGFTLVSITDTSAHLTR